MDKNNSKYGHEFGTLLLVNGLKLCLESLKLLILNLGSQAIKILSAGLHLPPPSVKTIAMCSDESRF